VDGDQIRARREARGWTQQQLAQEIGVGQRTVGNWERGETIPKNRLGRLRAVLDDEPDSGDPLRSATDVALLSELLRRAAGRDR
jgi:transcriptional regulator with XRE-family HTH domain